MESKPPLKILLAVPTMGLQQDPNYWMKSYLNILNDIRSNGCTHGPLFIYRDTWFSAMNKIFNVAFAHDFDYILRMDDDVWGVGQDYFTRLLKADKDVIGALYATRYFPYVYAALKRTEACKDKDLLESYAQKENCLTEVTGTGIQPCELIGMGLTLIKVAPFRLVNRPLFPDQELCPDDTYFAKICMDNGIKQFVDMDMKMAHREVTPMNRVYLMNADARMMLQNGLVKDDGTSDLVGKLIENFGPDGKKDIDKLVGI